MDQQLDDGLEKIDSLPILSGIDRKTKLVFAHIVPKKRLVAHASRKGREIRLGIWQYRKRAWTSDEEPLITALLDVAGRENGESCDLMPEESPVGEPQSNGEVDNSIKFV